MAERGRQEGAWFRSAPGGLTRMNKRVPFARSLWPSTWFKTPKDRLTVIESIILVGMILAECISELLFEGSTTSKV
jgi:hypothetical protein